MGWPLFRSLSYKQAECRRIGIHVDHILIYHYHTRFQFEDDCGYDLINSSLMGMDPWARGEALRPSDPGAELLIVKRNGIEFHPIKLRDHGVTEGYPWKRDELEVAS